MYNPELATILVKLQRLIMVTIVECDISQTFDEEGDQ